jgi:hypothetical protein
VEKPTFVVGFFMRYQWCATNSEFVVPLEEAACLFTY